MFRAAHLSGVKDLEACFVVSVSAYNVIHFCSKTDYNKNEESEANSVPVAIYLAKKVLCITRLFVIYLHRTDALMKGFWQIAVFRLFG